MESSADVLGHVAPGSAQLRGQEGICRTVWDLEDPAALRVYRKAKAGHLRGVSVGYEVHRYEVVPAADGQPELRIAVDWTPREVTACPVGADPKAGFRAFERTSPCSLVYRSLPPAAQAATGINMTQLLNRDMAEMEKVVAAIKAFLDGAVLKTDNDKELAAYKIHAICMGNASTPADPPAEEVGADGGTMAADNAAVADAAREVTGLKGASEVVRALYSLSVKSDRVSTLSKEVSERSASLRKARLDKAVEAKLLTPAKRALVDGWLRSGKVDDAWLDEELGAAVPQVDTSVIEPPDTKPAAPTSTRAALTPEALVASPAFSEFVKKQGYDEKEALLTARSWIKVNGPTAVFEAPSARF